MEHQWKPNAWTAAILGLFTTTFAFLYVNRPVWFWIYLLAGIITASYDFNVVSEAPDAAFLDSLPLSWIVTLACIIHSVSIARHYDVATERRWFAGVKPVLALVIGILLSVFTLRTFFFEPLSIPSGSMSPTLNPGDKVVISKYGYGNYLLFNLPIMQTEPTKIPMRGDIVVFQLVENPEILYVKRLVGLPGDTITYNNKTLSVSPACEIGQPSCLPSTLVSQRYSDEGQLSDANSSVSLLVESIGEQNYMTQQQLTRQDHPNRYYQQPGMNSGTWVVPEGNVFVLGDNRDNSLDSRYFGFIPTQNLVGNVIYIMNK